jgi:HK97 family phage major capsid protein
MPTDTITRAQTEREQDIIALRDRIGELRRAESVKREAADAYVDECKRAGLNPVTGTRPEDNDAFKRIGAAFKESDTLAEERVELEGRLETLVVSTGHEADARTRGDIQHPDMVHALGMAEKFIASEEYRSLKRSGALEMASASARTAAVAVASRDQLLRHLFPSYQAAGLDVDALVPEDQRLFPPVAVPVRTLKVRDLVAVGTTDTDTVEYVEETVRTDAAVETSYGVSAPESTYEYERKEVSVKRIPHHVKATKGNLADAGQLRSLLDNRLVYGVGKRLDTQIVNGNGAGDNITGILNTVNLAEVSTTGLTVPDALHKGLTSVRLSLEDEPDAYLIHPTTYQNFVLSKGTDGHYLNLQGPQMTTPPNVWGKPAVISTAIPATSVLVGNWKMGASLWLRSGINLAVTDSDQADFLKGIITILAEMRAAFAAVQIKAFAEITGVALS